MTGFSFAGLILSAGGRLAPSARTGRAASTYSTYKPLDATESALTRQVIGQADAVPLPPIGERIGLAQALRSNTLDAAYQLRLENDTGSIEVGKVCGSRRFARESL